MKCCRFCQTIVHVFTYCWVYLHNINMTQMTVSLHGVLRLISSIMAGNAHILSLMHCSVTAADYVASHGICIHGPDVTFIYILDALRQKESVHLTSLIVCIPAEQLCCFVSIKKTHWAKFFWLKCSCNFSPDSLFLRRLVGNSVLIVFVELNEACHCCFGPCCLNFYRVIVEHATFSKYLSHISSNFHENVPYNNGAYLAL